MFASPRRGLALVLVALLAAIYPARAADLPAGAGSWSGIYPTVVTPFRGADGGVDVAALDRQLTYLLRAGVQGLLVCDSFGEGEYLTPQERSEVIQCAVRRAFPRLPVIVGIHSGDVREAQRQALEARRLGASAVLVKYAGRSTASAAEVCQFVRGICDLQALPVFYDHCPARSGVDLGTMEMAQLLAMRGVVGIRESGTNLVEVEEHVRLCRDVKRAFFTASAMNLVAFLNAGGCGAMCPEAVLLPVPTEKAYRAYTAGRREEARAIQDELQTLAPIFRLRPALPLLERVAYLTVQDFKPAAPSGQEEPQAQMKAALTCLGVETPTWVKTPLPRLSGGDLQCVSATMSAVKKIDWCEVSMRVPPEPMAPNPASRAGGMLLKTGAFQLGLGVGKDLLRSVDDGHSGFFP